MRKLVGRVLLSAAAVLLSCLSAWADVAFNAANFPDSAFRSYITAKGFDANGDGNLSNAEINGVREIIVSNKSISSLKGIEHFTALTSLYCEGNRLTELDISKNTKLVQLFCSNNQLKTLDLRGNPDLRLLDCSRNSLTELDVSKNLELGALDCLGNKLKAPVNLQNNTKLSRLGCIFTVDLDTSDKVIRLDLRALSNAYRITGINVVHPGYYSAIDTETDGTSKKVISATQNYWKIDELKGVLYNLTTGIYNGRNKPSIDDDYVLVFPNPSSQTLEYIALIYGSGSDIKAIVVYPGSFSGTPGTPDEPSGTAPSITTSSLPDGAKNTPYNQTLTAAGDTPITWSLTGGSLPSGLSLSSAGTLSGTPAEAGTFTFTVEASNSAGKDSRTFTINIPFTAGNAPAITTTSLAGAVRGAPYGVMLTAGGTTPLTWRIINTAGGSLPGGLALNTSGFLSGTPSAAGTFTFEVQASNSAGSASAKLTLTVSEPPASSKPSISTEEPNSASAGSAYFCQLMASGTPPFTWSIKGKLPDGLSMSSSGLITGTPSKKGSKKITVTATNTAGSDTKKIALTVYDTPNITTEQLKDATVGKKYSAAIKGKGTKPMTWTADSSLPAGLTLDTDKMKITGTPTLNGKGMLKVTLRDPGGEASKVFTLNVNAILPAISTKKLKDGTYGKAYKLALKAKGTNPITMSISGSLPAGLTFDRNTNTITGTPTEVCSERAIKLTASNMGGSTVQEYKLTIKGVAPKITTKKLPDGTEGSNYSQSLEATGSPSITWAAEGLPGGLSISSGGVITGNPTEAGKFKVKVTATNSVKTVKKNYTLKIAASSTPARNHAVQIKAPENLFAAAVLPEVSVDVSGMYDFAVTLSDEARTGEELVYMAGSSEPSDDDEIAEFSDENGEETSTVPESHEVTLSVWLNKGVIYKPSIAVRR